jgi:hypothetical protein
VGDGGEGRLACHALGYLRGLVEVLLELSGMGLDG